MNGSTAQSKEWPVKFGEHIMVVECHWHDQSAHYATVEVSHTILDISRNTPIFCLFCIFEKEKIVAAYYRQAKDWTQLPLELWPEITPFQFNAETVSDLAMFYPEAKYFKKDDGPWGKAVIIFNGKHGAGMLF